MFYYADNNNNQMNQAVDWVAFSEEQNVSLEEAQIKIDMQKESNLVILRVLGGPSGSYVYSDVKNYINVTSLMKV